MELLVADTSGNPPEPFFVNFSVDGNQKVGNFTLSFTDLNVPVSGMPMQVVRTYDSRNQQQGDFGIGWTLDIHNIQVEPSGTLGDGWESYIQGGGLLEGSFGQIFIQSKGSHFVDIVMGNGKVYRFEPHFLDGSNNDVAPGGAGEQDISGGTYGVKMEPLFGTAPNCALLPIDGNGHPVTDVSANSSPDVTPDVLVWTDDGGNDYNPTRYLFTDENGNQYIVNTTSGLESLTSLSGDKLSVDSYGIHWVNNQQTGHKDITFGRDRFGRITLIKDPNGKLYNYTYGPSGDLLSYADPFMTQKNQKDTFVSNDPTDMVDPSGNQADIGSLSISVAVVAVLSSFPSVTYGGTVAQEKVYVGLNNRTLYLMSADNDLLFKAGIVAGAPDTPTFTGKFKLGDWEKDKTSKRWGVLSETLWSKSAIGANVFGAYFACTCLSQKG